jgi:hypothetical protein
MMTIPDAAFADMFERLGHTLHEYDGLAEALYGRELAKTKEAAPMKERPLFQSGVVMSSATGHWGVVDRTRGFRTVLSKPANRS